LLLLIGLGLLLNGCTTLPSVPSKPPEKTTPPALSLQIPTQNYSESVEQNFDKWDRRLKATLPTLKP
jgi:hypothetical protein